MIRAPISTEDMIAALGDINAVLPKYALDDPAEAIRIARLFREAILPHDREAVQGGAKLGLREWQRFPTPAAWRESIRTWIKHNRIVQAPQEEGQRDGEGRAILCKTCRSIARVAWLSRIDGSECWRLIAPCDAGRHHVGDPITEYPPNFIEWAEPNLPVAALALGRGAHLHHGLGA